MKTKEFMGKARSLEFGVMTEGHQIVIRTPGCSVVARINVFSQQTEILQFMFGSADRRELLNIIAKYTQTPPAEREEEKRYYLRKIPVALLKESGDLYYYEPSNKLFAPGVDKERANNEKFKSIFTESEISQMDITGFEKVEVSE